MENLSIKAYGLIGNNLYLVSIGVIEDIEQYLGKPLLNNCAVIEVQNIFPEHLMQGELKLPAHDNFHFLVKDRRGWSLYQKIPRSLDEKEAAVLDSYLEKHDWAQRAKSTGDVLSITISDRLQALVETINNIPGAMLNPNLLQKGTNLYICVMFQDSCRTQISDLVLDFVSNPEFQERSLVFYGKNGSAIPRLLNFYERENEGEGFLMIKTVWDFDSEAEKNENSGVFQNKGMFQPKYFEEAGKIKMIARLENNEVLGDAEYKWIDREQNLVEFSFASHFMEDFTTNVIERYSGPVFSQMVSEKGSLVSYYIIDKSKKDEFFRAISKHWSMPLRKAHSNRIELIDDIMYVRPSL